MNKENLSPDDRRAISQVKLALVKAAGVKLKISFLALGLRARRFTTLKA